MHGIAPDNRHVALIKSVQTNNRFYALVAPESGLRNAEIVESIPDDLLLGVAYPCLEDGLNDFAVIRTTFDTLDYFPDDVEMRSELMEIVTDARAKLERRLAELRDRLSSKRAHFLGADLNEFKSYLLDMMRRGYPRRNLDSMMKLNVFSAVAEHGASNGDVEPHYTYEVRGEISPSTLAEMPPRDFVARLFSDILDSVTDDANYIDRFAFDRNVFQKFIAMMFVNYATTDPIFYGTHKADYGVSADKDMNQTPLHMAVARELRAIEAELASEGVCLAPRPGDDGHTEEEMEPFVELPGMLVNEDVLLGLVSSIFASGKQLAKRDDRETAHFGRVIMSDASKLVRELKRLDIVSPYAYEPDANGNRRD